MQGLLGVAIHEQQTAQSFLIENGQCTGVQTKEGITFKCGHTILAAGAHSPNLLPELTPYIHVTGHPVFWLKPQDPELFMQPQLCVFAADISNTGWYGFPYLPQHGILKIASHTTGTRINPEYSDLRVNDEEVLRMRRFVEESFPTLAKAPLVYTRKCLYTDTLDGHYWIDQHPGVKGITVSTGGSGHGMKMGPILGEMTADVAEGKTHRFSKRYRWRELSKDTKPSGEIRNYS